jgi:purine catabolism regulator
LTASGAQRARIVDTAAAILSVLSPFPTTEVGDVVVRLLLDQDVDTARRVCGSARMALPANLVAVCVGGQQRNLFSTQALALGLWRAPSSLHQRIVLLGSHAVVEARVRQLAEQTSTRAGISTVLPPAQVRRAVHEATTALGLATAERPIAHYQSSATTELTTVLTSGTTRDFARSILLPLQDHPEKDTLIRSALAWTHSQGRWDPAAAALGIHRATLRSRMKRLARATGLDLGSPRDRLALALALEADPSLHQTEV